MVNERAKVTIYTNKDVTNVIKAKQFDALSRFLDVTLVNDRGEPHDLTDHKVRFNARRPDRGKIFNNCEIIDAKAGIVEVEFTDQALAVPGRLQADISIFSDDERLILTTRTFVVDVQPMIRDDEAIEGSNEYGAVLLLFQDVWDMRQVILSIDERIGTLDECLEPEEEQAGSSFGCALNRIWNYLKAQSTAGIVEIVNTILGRIGATDDTGGSSNTGSAMAKLNVLLTSGAMSTIKSTQRGTLGPLNPGKDNTITIADINPLKSLVTLEGVSGHSTYDTYLPYVVNLTINGLTVRSAGGSANNSIISWQIIEFY